MNVEAYIEHLKNSPSFMKNVTAWRVLPARAAKYADFPDGLDARLVAALARRGVKRPYSHQRLAIDAAEELAKQGIEARVLDMHTIKPLDTEAVNACIADIGKIVTVEDHNILNALGSAVCECVAEAGRGIVRRIGVQDQFGESAPYERLLAKNGITMENIIAQAKSIL
mgnify:CR=1 FL=1